MSDFPTHVYRCPGPHFGPGSSTFATLGVNNAEALRLALGDGWHRTLPEACAPVPFTVAAVEALPESAATEHVTEGTTFAVVSVEDEAHTSPFLPSAITSSPNDATNSGPEDSAEIRLAVAAVAQPTRAELERQAHDLGLVFGNRLSDENLAKKIADSLARVPHLAAKG